jgi:hypothetical protein
LRGGLRFRAACGQDLINANTLIGLERDLPAGGQELLVGIYRSGVQCLLGGLLDFTAAWQSLSPATPSV